VVPRRDAADFHRRRNYSPPKATKNVDSRSFHSDLKPIQGSPRFSNDSFKKLNDGSDESIEFSKKNSPFFSSNSRNGGYQNSLHDSQIGFRDSLKNNDSSTLSLDEKGAQNSHANKVITSPGFATSKISDCTEKLRIIRKRIEYYNQKLQKKVLPLFMMIR
jgi:hypothetical protein